MADNVIFMLDDNAEFGRLMEHTCKKFGAEVKFFDNFLEFLNALKKGPLPRLCFLDLKLGLGKDGFEVMDSIRQDISKELPVIILSRNGDEAAVVQSLKMGANDYLVKPLDRQLLMAKLSQYLHTDELLSLTESDIEVPEGGWDAVISFDLMVAAIDEMGINIRSKHLVSKGTVLKIGSKEMAEVFGKSEDVLVTIVTNELLKDGGYESFAEFEKDDENVIRCVRAWLTEEAA